MNRYGLPCSLQWRHNEHDDVSNHQRLSCLLNRLLRRRSKKHQSSASLAFVSPPVTGEFPAQRASDAEKVSIWWRHHGQDINRTCRLMGGECFICSQDTFSTRVLFTLGTTVNVWFTLPLALTFTTRKLAPGYRTPFKEYHDILCRMCSLIFFGTWILLKALWNDCEIKGPWVTCHRNEADRRWLKLQCYLHKYLFHDIWQSIQVLMLIYHKKGYIIYRCRHFAVILNCDTKSLAPKYLPTNTNYWDYLLTLIICSMF